LATEGESTRFRFGSRNREMVWRKFDSLAEILFGDRRRERFSSRNIEMVWRRRVRGLQQREERDDLAQE
jgi:hypothetical protein